MRTISFAESTQSFSLCVILYTMTLPVSVCAEERADEFPTPAVDFERHVAPLLGRLGCNSAACHGAFGGGKGGLQLSLFGHSARMDYRALANQIDVSDPESSPLLRKPGGLEDHGGGLRFEPDSESYRSIQQWIREGAQWSEGSGQVSRLVVDPSSVLFAKSAERQPLQVTAEFKDGTHEVVTHLCQFRSRDEGITVVEPGGIVARSGDGHTAVNVAYGNVFVSVRVLAPYRHHAKYEPPTISSQTGLIDLHIEEKLAQLRIVPSGPSSDEAFLRRLTLDTIGTIPAPEQVLHFCADTDTEKREKKIDEMLAHPMHAALWATRMCDITKCDVEMMGDGELLGARRAQMWHDWFRRRFEENVSYADIVRGVVTATSREDLKVRDWMTHEERLIHRSQASFESSYAERESLDLFWRRVGSDAEATLKSNAELVAVAFTGIRLNCAQCHKHPFDRWTQDDYAAFANIFSSVVYGSSTQTNSAVLEELARRRESRRNGITVRPLPRIREVFISSELGRALSGSDSGIDVSPRAFDSLPFPAQADPRQAFFEWLIAPDNPYFARSFANRVWATYFGIGLVDPVDDFSVTNPPSHPILLDELAESFRESEFDIRALEKRILMSTVYQRSAIPNESNRRDFRSFSRQYVRPLLAEVVLDALNKALGTAENFGDAAREGALAIEVGTNQLPGDAGRALQVFGRGRRKATCDCDRRTGSDLRQFIFLANDSFVHDKISTGSVRNLLSLNDRQIVEQLYLRVFGRKPDDSEFSTGLDHLRNADDRVAAFDDLVWALLNTREFITNH